MGEIPVWAGSSPESAKGIKTMEVMAVLAAIALAVACFFVRGVSEEKRKKRR